MTRKANRSRRITKLAIATAIVAAAAVPAVAASQAPTAHAVVEHSGLVVVSGYDGGAALSNTP